MFTAMGLGEAELVSLGRKVVRRNGKQVLLLARKGRVFALANRCPHEGFPLSEGTEGPGCVLTCNWHNWKFDLDSGAALIGRDPVRVYLARSAPARSSPTWQFRRQRPSAERALRGLDAAMSDSDLPRVAREVARLERAGFDAREALIHALAARQARFENGMTHAQAAAADWLALAERAPSPETRLAAMLEPLSHLAWDTLGAGEFPYAEGIARWDADSFLAAVEREDEAAALAHIRGALAGTFRTPNCV